MPRPAVFLDRDGVLNAVVDDLVDGRPESPLTARDTRLLPGAAGQVQALKDAGWAVVVVSNQPAAAKGKATLEELRAVHAVVRDALPDIDGWRYCLHHPQGIEPQLSGTCPCRKPAPGMLLAAAFELDLDLPASWMVGDSAADVGAGLAAGCHTVLVEAADTAHRRDGGPDPHHRAPDLAAAVALILGA